MIKHRYFSTYHCHLRGFAVTAEGTKDVKIFEGPDPKKGISGNLEHAQKALVGKKVKAGEMIAGVLSLKSATRMVSSRPTCIALYAN